MRWMQRDLARRALATAIGTLAAFLMLEVAMRVVVAADPLPTTALGKAAQLNPPNPGKDCSAPDETATLAHILRPSSTPGLVYELKPNVLTCYRGARHQTNLDGQRARSFEPFARPKPAGVFRVLLLGDSYAYAQSVDYEASFGAELERRLGARTASAKVEVINTGVPGYNTAQEATYLAARGMAYQPDCIVILFVTNDLGLPYLMLEPRNPLSLRRSYVLETLAPLWARFAGEIPVIPPGMTQAAARESNFVAEDELERIPGQYRYMVGVEGYRRALRAIAETAKGIPVIDVADYADVLGLRPADRVALAKFQEELGIHHAFVPIFRDKSLWIAEDDMHPNAKGHALLAERVLYFMEERKLCLP